MKGMKRMKRWKSALLLPMATVTLMAAQPMPMKKISTTSRYTMEVESVKYSTGTMVLRGCGTKRMTVHVDKRAHNLRKIHPGGWLEVVEHEEVTVEGQKGGKAYSHERSERIAGPKTKVPTLREEEVSTLAAKVVSIDHAKRTMLLEGPDGIRYEAGIKPGIAHLENLHPGDTVKATIRKIVTMRIRTMH